jgi:acyl-coenzyme A thioesterase PaaI-like protein
MVMGESMQTRVQRWAFNLFPAYRGTGARITYIARDWREVHLRVPLSWRTRNYVGTIFGGSMYGAVDPIYMLMLIRALGPEYVVWDKAARIRFKKPGRTTLYARFRLDEAELTALRAALAEKPVVDRDYVIELVDDGGVVHAVVEKTLHVRRADRGRKRAA